MTKTRVKHAQKAVVKSYEAFLASLSREEFVAHAHHMFDAMSREEVMRIIMEKARTPKAAEEWASMMLGDKLPDAQDDYQNRPRAHGNITSQWPDIRSGKEPIVLGRNLRHPRRRELIKN